eukprot:m.734435 g.734435  ORF g.734435 m.734435 type:complete len:79 (-) comp23084_c0_seq1:271-507(-)
MRMGWLPSRRTVPLAVSMTAVAPGISICVSCCRCLCLWYFSAMQNVMFANYTTQIDDMLWAHTLVHNLVDKMLTFVTD